MDLIGIVPRWPEIAAIWAGVFALYGCPAWDLATRRGPRAALWFGLGAALAVCAASGLAVRMALAPQEVPGVLELGAAATAAVAFWPLFIGASWSFATRTPAAGGAQLKVADLGHALGVGVLAELAVAGALTFVLR